MKRFYSILGLLALCAFFIQCSTSDKTEPEQNIVLGKSLVILEVGKTDELAISGGNGKQYNVTPSTSEIASVVVEGSLLKITGLKAGEQTFEVTSGGKKVSFKVVVKEKPIPDVTVSQNLLEIEVEQKAEIIVSGGNGKQYDVMPSTSEIASVVLEGSLLKITGLKAGEQTFEVTSGGKKVSFKVVVKEKPIPDVTVSQNLLEIEVEQKAEIIVSGGNGKQYDVMPSTSEIASVVLEGSLLKITGLKAGEQTFEVTSGGKKVSFKVVVKEKPIPDLGVDFGLFDNNNKKVFETKFRAKQKTGIWLFSNSSSPYDNPRVFLSKYSDGDSELLIIAYGISPIIDDTGENGKNIKVVKEKDLSNGNVQLRSGSIRLIVGKK